MLPSDEQCYRAVQSRDARFDGRFFTGVITTGIYCRPVCPARTPHATNVTFYPTAAAAEAAGFRPCLRCRPETAAGTPAWNGTSTTVTRALRLIEQGALDEAPLDALAARLGVGERHLRRLFEQHLGASPSAVAQTHRLHLAKQLIDGTALPMAQVAFAAGFQSVRRFDATIRTTYDRTPTQLRQQRRQRNPATLTLRLAYRPPFGVDALFAFLGTRAIAGIEHVEGHTYRRVVTYGESAGVITLTHWPERHLFELSLPPPLVPHLRDITRRAQRLLDLHADPETIDTHLGADAQLADPVRQTPGMRLPGAWSPFEVAVRAILGQQVSVAAASTLTDKLVATYGTALDTGDAACHRVFPSPDALAEAPLEALGLFRQRAGAIRALAAAVLTSDVQFDDTLDRGVLEAQLLALPGIGPWTASYIALRLGYPDAFPSGDLILRRAAAAPGETLAAKALAQRAEAWQPWRAYAALHLWTSYTP
ncbi:MAG: AlkA N-terminal domain-containing protein [Myxococcota bacterium]